MRAILITTLLGVTALCSAAAATADPCPANVVCVGGFPCDSLTSVSGGRSADFNGGVSASADYNWSTGSCHAFAQLPYISVPIEGKVEANENFVVTGIASGSPLTIHARIRVVANANTPGGSSGANHASGWLEKAGAGHVEATASAESPGQVVDVDQVLALDFPGLAGEAFRLTMGARSDARGGTSRVAVTLSFVDLPNGATVSSCHSSPPVPATPVSWGRLKSQYR